MSAVSHTPSISFKGSHFEESIILLTVRWYLIYNLSTRDLEEMRGERGVSVDYSTHHHWVTKYSQQAHAKKKPVGVSWRLDETYIKIKRQWKYLYRAVDKEGNTVDFLLTATRDTKAALQVSAQSDWLEWTPGEDLYR